MTQGGAIRARQRVAPRLSPFRVSRRFQVTVFEFYESRVEKQISALEPKRRGLPITTSDCAVRTKKVPLVGETPTMASRGRNRRKDAWEATEER